MSMALLLSKSELSQTEPAERAAFNSPVPTQIVSNGEFNPLPQTQQQRRVEERIKEIADTIAPKLGLDRRQFLSRSPGGIIACGDPQQSRLWVRGPPRLRSVNATGDASRRFGEIYPCV